MATATKVRIKPLGDRVVVKALEREEKTKSGIVLPDTAKEKPQEGEVVAVGEGRTLDNGQTVPVAVKPGERTGNSRASRTAPPSSVRRLRRTRRSPPPPPLTRTDARTTWGLSSNSRPR